MGAKQRAWSEVLRVTLEGACMLPRPEGPQRFSPRTLGFNRNPPGPEAGYGGRTQTLPESGGPSHDSKGLFHPCAVRPTELWSGWSLLLQQKEGQQKQKREAEHETFVGFGNFHGQMKKEKELRSLLLNEKRKGRKEYDTFVGFLMSKKIP